MARELLFVKHKKELTSDGFGSPLWLSAGATVVLKRMTLDTMQRCIFSVSELGER